MANRIQLRRGGAQEWANSNPTLAQGELGVELDTGRFKIGDGVTAWNSLRYERPVESTSNTANTLVQRDPDGNFAAGTVTATLIGNSSTATRLASTRQIQLSDDIQASGVFDGSTNLNLATSLELISTLPHYDGTGTAEGTYTKVTVDAKGRIKTATNPTTIQAYGLDTSIEGSGAQPYDNDLNAIASLTTTGLISRTSSGSMSTRTITGTAARISITDGGGINDNPTIDLITTAVTAGDYNTESLTSVSGAGSGGEPFGTETVNATKFTVDAYGRLTSATNVPIATATQGTTASAYDNAATYSRNSQITNASNLYQAIADINAGAGAPTHTDGTDAGSWRWLGASATPQKGLASFDQEDFDVSAAGHVTFAASAIDNDQLQNSRISFADGNSKEDFDLDQELTATSGYRGFNYLNYVKVNDTSGNLLFGANNTGDSSAGEVDINVRTYISDPDITLDGAVAQTLDKTGDGNLTFQTTQNSNSARSLSILATNSGSGTSTVTISAEDVVDIDASDAGGKVHVENLRFQGNYMGGTGDILIDPNDDRDVTGLVTIRGNLQVDGTTTTVNSTVTTLDDPIITLGGDTAPGSDDGKDRGVEFRYYDTQARVGFFGYDDSATDLGGHSGAFSFLYDATNTSEVFAGTDAGLIAGNLKLTTNTNSTSNTTGDLVVAGGAGIGDDVNIGGSVDIDTNLTVHGTTLHDDNIVIQGASKVLQLNNGSGTNRIELQSTTGNASFYGVVDITNNLNINSNKFNVTAASGNTAIAGTLTVSDATTIKADGKFFKIQTANATDKFTVDTDNGDTNTEGKLNVADLVHIESTDNPNIVSGAPHTIGSGDYGALRVDGGGYFDKDVLFNGDLYLNGDFNQQEDATENYGLRNYLSVRYKLRTGSVAAYTPSYSNHNTSNLRVFGGAGVNTSLHVGGTGSGEGFFVGKKNNGDSIKFQVLGASGDITSEGDLVQNGNSEFNGTVDVDADFAVRSGTTDKFFVDNGTGNTNIEGTLTVDAAAELNSTLNVDAGATFQDNVTINANNKMFKIQNNSSVDKFTVDTDNGNTETQGTLTVQGQTNIIDSLIINAANEVFDVQDGSANSKFSVDTDNGNTNIIGTLTVGDATQINDTFGTSGVNTFTNNTEQTLTGSYGADGAARFTGGVGIARNLAVGGAARVYGNTELTGTLDLNNDADISGNLVVSNTQDASSLADSSVALQVSGGATIDKNTYVGGNFVVYDAGNTRSAFTVTNSTGDGEFHNDLTVGGNLIVNGSTTTVNSTVTTLDDPIITLGGDTAPASNDAKDRGVEFRYYDGSAKIGFFGYDRSANQFSFVTDATNTSEVLAGTDGALRAGSLNLTGGGTSLDVDNNANIDGTLTVDGQFISNLSTGTAPFSIASTTKVNNLNVDYLDNMTTASANTASTVVNRDASGDFAANQITAASGTGAGAGFLGNASTADTWKTARVLTIDGVVNGNVSIDGSAAVTLTTTYDDDDITALAAQSGTGYMVRTQANTYAHRTFGVTANSGITLTNADGISGNTTINVASASTNAANNLVIRDASGDFAANEITADLVGNLTGATSTAKDLNPASDSSYDLGTNTVRWQNIYADAANITAITGTLTGDVTGNADTATALQTARDIGGVSFDGTASINLPGVNTAGNQDTSGTAAVATTITVADESTDTSCNVLFTTDATGNLGAKTGTNLTFNSSTGVLTATGFAGPITGEVTGNASTATALATSRTIGGTAFNGTADITPATATQAANLNNHDTADLAEGTNLYYTEARVQAKLDNAYLQLQAMLNNLATATTLTLNLSGDPTPGSVVTLGAITAGGVGGFSNGTGVATSGGTGTGLTVDTTTVNGVITGIALNAAGSDYLVTDTLTITNPNLGGANSLNLGTLSGGTGYTTASNVSVTGGSGSNLTVDITAVAGSLANVVINNAGTGYSAGETITILNANATGVKTLGTISAAGTGYTEGTTTGVATSSSGSGTGLTVDVTANASGNVTAVAINVDGLNYAASEVITISGGNGDATIPVSAIHGNGATVNLSTVFTNATFALSDITTMEVGATVTGGTSGTTGVITALGATSVTVDNVDGFFKKGETVGANDVTNLTIQSFA